MQAAEAPASRILDRAAFHSPMGICGPSYFNDEGGARTLTPGEEIKAAAREGEHLPAWKTGTCVFPGALEGARDDGGCEDCSKK